MRLFTVSFALVGDPMHPDDSSVQIGSLAFIRLKPPPGVQLRIIGGSAGMLGLHNSVQATDAAIPDLFWMPAGDIGPQTDLGVKVAKHEGGDGDFQSDAKLYLDPLLISNAALPWFEQYQTAPAQPEEIGVFDSGYGPDGVLYAQFDVACWRAYGWLIVGETGVPTV